jgi:predicted homoserine dehydrogenase-like protein
MATGQVLRRPVAAGALLTRADVAPPAGSALWALRDEQDAMV